VKADDHPIAEPREGLLVTSTLLPSTMPCLLIRRTDCFFPISGRNHPQYSLHLPQPGWVGPGGLLHIAQRWSPIPVLTGLNVE